MSETVHYSLIVGGDIVWTVSTAEAEVIDIHEEGRRLLVRDQLRHQDHAVTVTGDTWERLEAATPGLDERRRLCQFGYTRGGEPATVSGPRRRLATVTVPGYHDHRTNWDYPWETVSAAAERDRVLPG